MELEIQSNSPESEAVAKKFPGLSDGCDYALNRLFTNFVFADRKRDSDGKPVGMMMRARRVWSRLIIFPHFPTSLSSAPVRQWGHTTSSPCVRCGFTTIFPS